MKPCKYETTTMKVNPKNLCKAIELKTHCMCVVRNMSLNKVINKKKIGFIAPSLSSSNHCDSVYARVEYFARANTMEMFLFLFFFFKRPRKYQTSPKKKTAQHSRLANVFQLCIFDRFFSLYALLCFAVVEYYRMLRFVSILFISFIFSCIFNKNSLMQ